MFNLDTSAPEIMFRAFSIYAGLFILFRLVGKKQLGEMSPFDLVLVLIISESVSNSLGAEENSIAGGLLSAATLIGLSYLMDFFAYKSKRFEKLADGEVRVIIKDGVINKHACRRERITKSELEEALRELKIERIEDVRIGYIETNGQVTAFTK